MLWPCFELWHSLGRLGDLGRNMSDSASWFLWFIVIHCDSWSLLAVDGQRDLWAFEPVRCWPAGSHDGLHHGEGLQRHSCHTTQQFHTFSKNERMWTMNAYIILQKKLFRFLFSHVFPFSCALSLEQKWLQVRRILSLDPSKYKNGRLPFGLKPDKGVALTEGADLEEKRRNDKKSLQNLVFHICVLLGGLHFLGLWQEEVERLREIIERLKEENDQLTRQLEAWQCKFYLFYIAIQQTLAFSGFWHFLSLWCFCNFLPCFVSLIFCDGANRQPGPQPSGGRPNLWSSRRNWRTNPRQTGKIFALGKYHRAESLESLEWLTGGDQSWGWSTSCPVRLWWFASVFQLTNRHVETRPVETPKQTREEPAPVIQGVSDEEVKRLGPLTRFSFDFNWSNVNSFVQRCSFLFAFLVSFCVTEATGRAREGPNDLNACYRCCFFLQIFQFSSNPIWKHFCFLRPTKPKLPPWKSESKTWRMSLKSSRPGYDFVTGRILN